MKIEKIIENKNVTVKVEGRIDTSNYRELEEELGKIVFQEITLTLDFTDVPYITSSGLRVLLVCRKRLTKETMILRNVNPQVKNVLDTSGFTDYFTFEYDNPEQDMTFTKMLSSRVEEFGETKKIFQGTMGYSFAEIDRCSDLVASDLAKQGVGKGSHVAICSPNTINWLICFFAIQKLNAIAIFVNFTLKPSEITLLSEIGDITHFCYGFIPGVTDYDAFISSITGENSEIRYTYNINPKIDFRTRTGEQVCIPENNEADPDDPSLMIFTSGSTGKPKGVLYSAYNMLTSGVEAMKLFMITREDRICLFLPLFHIFGFGTSFLPALFCGASVFIPANTHPDVVLNTISENGCTIFHSIPTMIFSILKNPGFTPEKMATVRCTYMGGAPITEEQMEMLMKVLPNNHFGNIYGMSEKPLISITSYGDTAAHITRTIGKPVSSVSLQIRELGTGRVCSDGEIGEITIKSDGALTSYYKLDISSQALDDQGWLPTGDLGYVDTDGYLRITGRCKELIIRAGENISPNEVAAALCRIEEISDAKVFGAPDDILGEKVVAAIIVKDASAFDAQKTNAVLATMLAKAKIPEKYIVYDRFPVLGTGKVDSVTLKKDVLSKI